MSSVLEQQLSIKIKGSDDQTTTSVKFGSTLKTAKKFNRQPEQFDNFNKIE